MFVKQAELSSIIQKAFSPSGILHNNFPGSRSVGTSVLLGLNRIFGSFCKAKVEGKHLFY